MLQFLLCSTAFNKKQYTVLKYEKKDNVVEKLHYYLTHREDAVIWPLFVKSDIEELLIMEPSLSKVLKDVVVGSDTFKIKYKSRTYEIDEIALSNILRNQWRCSTNGKSCLFHPDCITLG